MPANITAFGNRGVEDRAEKVSLLLARTDKMAHLQIAWLAGQCWPCWPAYQVMPACRLDVQGSWQGQGSLQFEDHRLPIGPRGPGAV